MSSSRFKLRITKGQSRGIELVVRGVLVKDGHVLLVHSKKARNTYLPGGHIEFGESAVAALKREIREELGFRAKITDFLGFVEHGWTCAGIRSQEINLIFRMEFECPASGAKLRSREKKIEFRWQRLSELKASRLEPRVLRDLLPRWLKKNLNSQWGSTLIRLGKWG